MLGKNFSFSQGLVLSIIFFNILAVSVIPGLTFSEKNSYFLQIFIFLFITIINLDLGYIIRLNRINFKPHYVLIFLMCFSFFLSSFYINITSNFEFIAIAKLLSTLVVVYYFFCYIPRLVFNEDELFEKFLNYWLYFSVFAVIVSLLMLVVGFQYSNKLSAVTVGFFYYTNVFAFVFTFTIPILVYKYFTKQISLSLFLILQLLSSICLLFTYSRAGYIGMLVSVFIMVYKKSKILLVTLILFFLLISTTFVVNFAKAKGGASAISRVQVMYVAYNMIFNHGSSQFLWGYGILNSKKVFIEELAAISSEDRIETGPHNFILTLGIQYGMVLTISVCIFLAVLLIKSFIRAKPHKYSNKLYYKVNLCIAITAAILIECFFEDIVIYPEFYVMPMFLVFLGYLYRFVYGESIKV